MKSGVLSILACLAIAGLALCLPVQHAEALSYSNCELEADLDDELESDIPPQAESLWDARCGGYTRRLFKTRRDAVESLKKIRRDLARLQKIEQPTAGDVYKMEELVDQHYYVKADFFEWKLTEMQSLMASFGQYEKYHKWIAHGIERANEDIDKTEFKRRENLKQNNEDKTVLLSDDDYLY